MTRRGVLFVACCLWIVPALSWAVDPQPYYLSLIPANLGGASISVADHGAVGDGITDDTIAIQAALTQCSKQRSTCVLQTGKIYKITAPLYIWGEANLFSWETSTTAFGELAFSAGSAPYLFNIGISGNHKPEQPWSGTMKNIGLRVTGGTAWGRILYFWRVNGGVVTGTVGDVGTYPYSLTSSGNDNAYLSGNDAIRKNITISNNVFHSTGGDLGSEGVGMGSCDGLVIDSNTITGVGDDVIGVHYCSNVVIRDNTLTSTDGRIFAVNSVNVKIHDNHHTRVPRGNTGLFIPGIALIYIGHEMHTTSGFYAPENIDVRGNTLVYPEGALDAGGAITIYGARAVTVSNNTILNHSSLVTAHGIYTAPWEYSEGTWTDPTGLDGQTARVRDITIAGNQLVGAYPLSIVQTGPTASYLGTYTVALNISQGIGVSSSNRNVGMNFTGQPITAASSTLVSFDASHGTGHVLIDVNDGSDITITNPTNPAGGPYYGAGVPLVLTIRNLSSGPLGSITWGSHYKLAGPFIAPASGHNRSITFQNSSVYGVSDQWRETSRTEADVPN